MFLQASMISNVLSHLLRNLLKYFFIKLTMSHSFVKLYKLYTVSLSGCTSVTSHGTTLITIKMFHHIEILRLCARLLQTNNDYRSRKFRKLTDFTFSWTTIVYHSITNNQHYLVLHNSSVEDTLSVFSKCLEKRSEMSRSTLSNKLNFGLIFVENTLNSLNSRRHDLTIKREAVAN